MCIQSYAPRVGRTRAASTEQCSDVGSAICGHDKLWYVLVRNFTYDMLGVSVLV